MNILKVINGKVEIRNAKGSLVRTIAHGHAVAANFNADQTLILITTDKGSVEIRKDNGTLVRTVVPSGAVGASWLGADISVSTTKGKTEIRKQSGSLIRTM